MKLALETPITGATKAVLLVLAWYADSEGGRVWPSVPTIARQSGASERHVRRALIDLKACGWLVLEKLSSGKLPNGYRLALPLTPRHPGRSVTPDKVSSHPGHGVTPTPDTTSATPDTMSPNPSVIPSGMYVNQSGARASSPNGLAAPEGMDPEQIAAAKRRTRESLGLPPVRTSARKPFWARPDQAPDPSTRPADVSAALAEIAKRRASADVPRGTPAATDTAGQVPITAAPARASGNEPDAKPAIPEGSTGPVVPRGA